MPRRLLVVMLAACSILVQAQQSSTQETSPGQTQAQLPAAQQSEARTKISVNSELVVLPVTVKDRYGNLVPDLQREEFRIFDDNVEQSIEVFTAEAIPLSLVVLVDDDLKSKDAAQMAPALRAITAGINTSDEVLICRFDLSFYPGDGFTGDLDKLRADLKDAQDHSGPSTAGPVPFVTPPSSHARGVGEPPPGPATNLGSRPTKALDDAVHSAAGLLHDRGASRRKIILLISDGLNGPQFNRHTYADTLEALLHDNISVYSLAVGHSLKRKFSRLVNYASDSGGDIYYAVQSAALERLYSRITEEARHEYTLAYVPRGNSRNANYHKVEVRTTRGAVTIKTRRGYYTGPLVDLPKQ
ncbi:MAG TPA: VWA domain-containing protein [Candidatus Acidoferrum sp.]|nr:VWA domain-containing protein [Candidatus Acidoferrum sp.]